MQGNALVSIIIPAYNTAPYVFRAIESSLRQTHPNIEVLVIDDGSTDDTLRVVMSYAEKDKRVRVYHQENAGVSAARNHGIREAHGEYIIFLDSDDWLEDDAVEVLYGAQMKYPDKFICANYYDDVQIDGNSMTRKLMNNITLKSRLLSFKDVAEDFCYFGQIEGFHNTHAKFFRASFGIKFTEGIPYCEDAAFFVNYMYHTNGIYYLNRPILNILARRGSAIRSSHNPAHVESLLNAYNTIINHPANTPEVKKLMRISLACYFMNVLNRALASAGSKEIERVRRGVRPYAADFLRCEKISKNRKKDFIHKVYTPVFMMKAIRRTKSFLKKIPLVMKIRDMLRGKN